MHKLVLFAVFLLGVPVWSAPKASKVTFMEVANWDRKAQIKYFIALGKVAIELDKRQGKRKSASADVFWKMTFPEADAAAGKAYCTNVGYIKIPCPDGNSNFPTRDILSPLGSTAAGCPAELEPCSPIFGFKANGSLFCSSNSTGSCKTLSEDNNGYENLTTAVAFCKSNPNGVYKVDESAAAKSVNCDAFIKMLQEQMSASSDTCDKSSSNSCKIISPLIERIRKEQSLIELAAPELKLENCEREGVAFRYITLGTLRDNLSPNFACGLPVKCKVKKDLWISGEFYCSIDQCFNKDGAPPADVITREQLNSWAIDTYRSPDIRKCQADQSIYSYVNQTNKTFIRAPLNKGSKAQ